MRTHVQLDGCIVWNVHNTVFGSKSAQLQHLQFYLQKTYSTGTRFAVCCHYRQ